MLYLAVLWHQHQPIYKNTAHPTQAGSYLISGYGCTLLNGCPGDRTP